jgi:hypothetical protein
MVAEVYAKPGKPAGQETYMKYEMENVMITSYS